jgi:hypothetical protein
MPILPPTTSDVPYVSDDDTTFYGRFIAPGVGVAMPNAPVPSGIRP